jgi:hypothetical protein
MREKGYGKRSRGEVMADRKRWRRLRREAVLGRSVPVLFLFPFSFFESAARWGARFIQRKEGVRKEVPDDGHDRPGRSRYGSTVKNQMENGVKSVVAAKSVNLL